MRSSVAAAGSAAVLMALLVAGCDSGTTSGSPVQATTTTATSGGGGALDTSRPAIDPTVLDAPDPLESLAGDWRQDTTSNPILAHVAEDGSLTLTQGGQTIKGQLVYHGEKQFRILLITNQGTPPDVTADLSDDGNTMTVHSSDEPGPIVYKRVG